MDGAPHPPLQVLRTVCRSPQAETGVTHQLSKEQGPCKNPAPTTSLAFHVQLLNDPMPPLEEVGPALARVAQLIGRHPEN